MLYCFYTPSYFYKYKKNFYIQKRKNKIIKKINNDLRVFPLSKLSIIIKFFEDYLIRNDSDNTFEYLDIDIILKHEFNFKNYIYFEILNNPIKFIPHFFYLKLERKFLKENIRYFNDLYKKIKFNFLNKKIKWKWFYKHCDEYFLIFVLKKLKKYNNENFKDIYNFNKNLTTNDIYIHIQ